MSWKTNRSTKKKFKSEIQEALERAGLGKDYDPTIPILEAKIERDKAKLETGYDESFYPGKSEREVGMAECGTVDVNLPLDDRVLAEVRQYNQRYGLASWADVTLEYNSRCKDPDFQGKEFVYAYTDIPLIKDSLERLVKEGKLRKIKVEGAEPGYVVED